MNVTGSIKNPVQLTDAFGNTLRIEHIGEGKWQLTIDGGPWVLNFDRRPEFTTNFPDLGPNRP